MLEAVLRVSMMVLRSLELARKERHMPDKKRHRGSKQKKLLKNKY
jgi:hypothetical protein